MNAKNTPGGEIFRKSAEKTIFDLFLALRPGQRAISGHVRPRIDMQTCFSCLYMLGTYPVTKPARFFVCLSVEKYVLSDKCKHVRKE